MESGSESPKPIIDRRKWFMAVVASLFVIACLNRFSLEIVSAVSLFYTSFSIHSMSFGLSGHGVSAAPSGRSLLSFEPQCDDGTVSVVVDIRGENSPSDGQVPTKEGNLRLSYPVITLNAAQNNGDHKLSARLAANHKHKNRLCLRSDSEYVFTFGSAEKADVLSGVRVKLCGGQFSTISKQIAVRATLDRCSAREIVASSSKISSTAVDCTDEPTSAPTSMPTRFVPSSNTTSSGNNQEIYETTTFISTVSAVGGTTLVATVGGVAYAAARSAKYFVQVPFAPEDLAMQI